MSEPEATAAILAAVGLLILLAGIASPVSRRLGVPALLLFLLHWWRLWVLLVGREILR